MQHAIEHRERKLKENKNYKKRARYSATHSKGVIPRCDTCFHSFEMNVYSPRVI